MKTWGSDEVQRIMRLYDLGHTSAFIAEEMNVTRNTVAGVIQRNKSRERAATRPSIPRSRKTRPATPAPPVRPPEDPRTALLWIDRSLSQCAHLLTDPHAVEEFADMIVCGAPVRKSGESYCAYHHSLFYLPPRASTRKEFIIVKRFATD